MSDDAFSSLTPDLIMDAVELTGNSPSGQFTQLNSLENRVFDAETEDGGRLILKFYRSSRWSDAAILEEHVFLRELEDSGAPVSAPLALKSGITLMKAGTFSFAAWKRFPGRIADEFSESMLHHAGRSLGLIHEVGSRGAFAERPALDASSLVLEPFQRLKESVSIPSDILPDYEECALAAAKAIQTAASMPRHRIHGDFHWGNILWAGDDLKIVDFDDACVGPAVQDVWMIAPATDPEGVERRRVMLEGYRSVRPFQDEWLSAIGALKAARFIDYSAWIRQRFDEPVFASSFPGFGTREYWEAELKDLKAVLVTSLPASIVPEHIRKEYEEASKLTNKDYFFDL